VVKRQINAQHDGNWEMGDRRWEMGKWEMPIKNYFLGKGKGRRVVR
jgi:hypothetical protein